jgi:hypothetical protein
MRWTADEETGRHSITFGDAHRFETKDTKMGYRTSLVDTEATYEFTNI